MIPKTLHYCWFGGAPLSALNQRCLESWQRFAPDFRLQRWDESNTDLDHPYARDAIAQQRWSRLSNLVRLQVLHAQGGVYLDTDVELLKPLDPLLGHGCFAGFQQLPYDTDWINTAVLGAAAGHPFLLLNQRVLEALHQKQGQFYRSPTIATRVLIALGLRSYGRQEVGGVALYPSEYFYPYPWNGRFTPECIKPETYCIHHWEGSWWKPQPA